MQILDQESQFQGVLFDGESSGGTHTLQLLDKEGNVPATSLLHIKTDEILNKEEATYISDYFTTSSLNTINATIGALTVAGHTTLSTLTVTGDTILNSGLTASGQTITASTFVGSLSGNATTASNFNSDRNFTFSDGDISGSATSSTGGYKIAASIIDNHVTEAKIADGAVTNDKITDGTIKTEKIGFGVTMTLTVSDKTLVLSVPELENNEK